MLVITRRIEETMLIGSDVSVTVLGVQGNQVRLGITAPKGVRVDREEKRLQMIASGDPALASIKPVAPQVESSGRPESIR